MARGGDAGLTAQQAAWFASLRANLGRDTGRSLEEWVAVAKTCPETGHRARLAWFKREHGLLQNRASLVLSEAFPEREGWEDPQALREALWSRPGPRRIFERLEVLALALPEVVAGQRKGYSAFSRRAQFLAVRPDGEGVRVGLATPPEADPKLEAAGREAWSERLRARARLLDPDEAPALEPLIRAAWNRS